MLHELAVRRDRVVADGLDSTAAKVCAHILKRTNAILADLRVHNLRIFQAWPCDNALALGFVITFVKEK